MSSLLSRWGAALLVLAPSILLGNHLQQNGPTDPWTMWRKNPQRRAVTSLRSNIPNPPLVKWRQTPSGLGEGSPVVGDLDLDGRVEVVTATYNVIEAYRFDGQNWVVYWSQPMAGQFNICNPAIADVTGDSFPEVINSNTNREIICRNGRTGQAIWTVNAGSRVWGGPAIADMDGDGRVDIVSAAEQRVFVLRGDGTEIWSQPLSLNSYSSATLGDCDGDGDLDVIVGGLSLRAFEGRTGTTVLWTAQKAVSEATCCFDDLEGDGIPEVAYHIDGREIGVLNARTGAVVWTYTIPSQDQGIPSSPVTVDINGDGVKDVICANAGGQILGLDGRRTGVANRVLWQFQHQGSIANQRFIESSGSVGDADGDGDLEYFVGSHLQNLYCLDVRTGAEQWRFAAAPGGEQKVVSSPTLADVDGDGNFEILVGSNGGGFWCLGGPFQPGTTPPPPSLTVRITAPSANQTVSGTVTVSAEVTGGSGTASVQFFVDGNSIGTDNAPPYSVQWNTSGVTPGVHTIRATATSGSQTASDEIPVNVPGTTPPPPATGRAWPYWHQNMQNTGYQPVRGRLTGLTEQFRLNVMLGESTPGFRDVDGDGDPDTVSFSYTGLLRHYDVRSQTLIREIQVGPNRNSSGSNPLNISNVALGDLDGDGWMEACVVSRASDARTLYCVDLRAGAIRWQRDIGGDGMSNPMIVDVNGDGSLDVVVDGSSLLAIRNDNSGLIWSYGVQSGHSAPAFGDVDGDGALEVVLPGSLGSGIVVVDGRTGQLDFTISGVSGLGSGVVITDLENDGTADLVCASPSQGVFAFNARTRAQRWRFNWGSTSIGYMNTPAVADLNGDGVLDVVAGAGRNSAQEHWIYAINGSNGQQIWRFQPNGNLGWTEPSPVICDLDGDGRNDVVYRTYDAFLRVFEGATGAVKWQFQFTGQAGNAACSPIAADYDGDGYSDLVVQNSTGNIHFFGTPEPPPNQAPTVRIDSPLPNATVQGQVTIRCTASDDSGNPTVTLTVGSTQIGQVSAPPYNFVWDTTGVANGSYTLTATARDAAGLTATATVTVALNNSTTPPPNEAPTVRIDSPAPNATLQGTASIQCTASDDGGNPTVTVTAGSTQIGQLSAPPYSFSWDTTQVANGGYTITATARDSQGLTATATVTVTVNNGTTPPPNQPPTVQITAPANNATLQGTVTVSATASDDGGNPAVTFAVNGSQIGQDSVPPYQVSWDTTSVADGSYTITATARDAQGATAQASITVTVNNPTATNEATFTAIDSGNALQSTGSFNRGGTTIRSGLATNLNRTLALILFDVSNLPSGVTIQQMELQLTGAATGQTNPAGAEWTVQLLPDSAARNFAGLTYATATVAPAATFPGRIRASDAGQGIVNRVTLDRTLSKPERLAFRIDPPSLNQTSALLWNGVGATSGLPRLVVRYTQSVPAPTVQITTPAANATVQGNVTISAGATNAVGVRFFVNSTLIADDTSDPYGATWDSTSVANGTYTIRAEARNSAGQTVSAQVTVTVNNPPPNQAPTVQITAPANGATVQGTVTVSATASDDGGNPSVTFAVGPTALETVSAPPYQVSWNTAQVANGTYTITATARDAQGLTATATVTVNVNNPVTPPPNQAPTVQITAPANGATVQGTVTVSATASDDGGNPTVTFAVNGNQIGQVSAPPYQVSWNTAGTANGAYTLTATARDSQGLTAQASIAVTVNNPTVNNPPTVSITAPSNGTTVSGTVTINAEASDDGGAPTVDFAVNGNFLSSDSSSPYSASWNTAGLPNGSYTIRATARDAQGLTATAEVTVTVNNTPAPTTNVLLEASATGHGWEGDGGFYQLSTEFRSGSDGQGRRLIGMIRFDLSSIPANTTITRLELDMTGSSSTFAIPQGTQWTVDLVDEATAVNWASLRYQGCLNATSQGRFTPTLNRGDLGGEVVNRLSLDGLNLARPGWMALRVNGPVTAGFSYYAWASATQATASRRPHLRVYYRDGAPTVTVTQPADGSAVFLGPVPVAARQVKIVAEATDDTGIARVDFYVAGLKIGSVPAPGPYEIVWDASRLPTCRRRIRAVAVDLSGQMGSHEIEVVVDRDAPTMAVDGPRDREVVRGTARVRVSARDNHRLQKVEVYVDDALAETCASGEFDCELDTTQLPDGEHTVRIVAEDTVGNKVETSSRIRVRNGEGEKPAVRGRIPPRRAVGGRHGIHPGGGIHIRIRIRGR